jgi:hypothetical protein
MKRIKHIVIVSSLLFIAFAPVNTRENANVSGEVDFR